MIPPIAEFYKGKTVRIIVGFSAGGGYDAYSRVIGPHLHKHIPGNPTVVVDNMAGSLLGHAFSLRPEPHIEHQQEGDLSSILSIRSPCVQVAPNA